MATDPEPPLVIPLYYDFASTLCYVAHRVVERLAPEWERIGVSFDWRPLDLAALLNWRRGGVVPQDRLANVERVAGELGIPVRIPPRWLDSRSAAAIALLAPNAPRAATWRERVFTDVFEQGNDPGEAARCVELARALGFELDEAGLEDGFDALESNTRAAAESEVTGVPTFMLDQWAFGGIQNDRTMVTILERFVTRRRT